MLTTLCASMVNMLPSGSDVRGTVLVCLTSEFQSPELEGDESVADFYDVHQRVQVVGRQHEAVPGGDGSPAAHHQVPAQAVLQRPRQVLVKDRVQVVIVRTCPEITQVVQCMVEIYSHLKKKKC